MPCDGDESDECLATDSKQLASPCSYSELDPLGDLQEECLPFFEALTWSFYHQKTELWWNT